MLKTDKDLMRDLIASRLAPFVGRSNDEQLRHEIVLALEAEIEPQIATSFSIAIEKGSDSLLVSYSSGGEVDGVVIEPSDVAKASEENATRFRIMHASAADAVGLVIVAAEHLPARSVVDSDAVIKAAQEKFDEALAMLNSLLD